MEDVRRGRAVVTQPKNMWNLMKGPLVNGLIPSGEVELANAKDIHGAVAITERYLTTIEGVSQPAFPNPLATFSM